MKNITHFFEIDKQQYALDYRNLFFCLLNEETKSALEQLLRGKPLDDESYHCAPALNALSKSGYFFSKYPDNPTPKFTHDVLNISFAPVQDCNFACKYCYADGGKGTSHYKSAFSKEQIDKMLEQIYKGRYSEYKRYKFDFVSGGEPLLDFPALEYFLKKARSFEQQLEKPTTVLIVTNGTLLTKEIVKTLDSFDVFLGISVDGPNLVHNRNRVYKDGSDTFDDVASGISLLRSMAEISSKLKDAWAMAVITRETEDLADVMETCISLGFKRMQMQLIRETEKHYLAFAGADLPELKAQYKALFEHVIDYAKKGDLSRLKMIANDNDSFGKFLSRLLLRLPVYYRCFAGRNKIAIAPNGEIYPCDSFCGLNDFLIGSLDSEEVNAAVIDMFEKVDVRNRHPCAKCWARNICGGDCYYNSYLVSGNIFDPDPIKCEMNKFFIENAVALLIRLQEIDRNHILYLAKMLSLS
ncbi:MAG: SPASM domain-containing protein [Oscillospiraceae bacterium]|nr:SPASM domain-containing protein [Oscillospiraceae bacterium]